MFGSVVLGNSQFFNLVMVQQNRESRLLLSLRIECVCQLVLLLGCQHLEVEVLVFASALMIGIRPFIVSTKRRSWKP